MGLAFATGTAFAQGGMNLSWNDCGASGAELRFFACDTNTGNSTLYVSATAPAPMPQLNGVSIVIDVMTDAAAISPWWQLGTGGCRSGTLTPALDFTSEVSCADPWTSHAAGGVQWTSGFNGPNRPRLRGVAAIAGSTSAPDGEMYLFAFRFSNLKSTGAGSCDGCMDKMLFILSSVQMTQPAGAGDYTITSPLQRQTASWRCTGFDPLHGGPPTFSCTTPVKQPSWGAIKSLYR